jgi:serpin B
VLDKALHETWLSIDEEGIEAAAATVLTVMLTSAPVEEPVPVTLDRPFLFRIIDDMSGATLFAGRIMDPTA